MEHEDHSAADGGESMSMSAAATKVFNTTELLEATLLMLHPRDLLFSQRVCKRWRVVVQGSISIKKALFLEPGIFSDTRSWSEFDHEHKPETAIINIHDENNPKPFNDMMELLESYPVRVNALLTMQQDQVALFPEALSKFLNSPMILCDMRPELLFAHVTASCRRMYFTQPPISVRIFDVDFCSLWAMEPRHPRPHRELRKFRNVRTFGDLIDVVKEKIEGEERLKIMKCLRIMVGVGPEEVKAWVKEYGGK